MATRMPTSGFLPTIKCSNCSVEIEISMMGDHVCSHAPMQPQARFDRFNNALASMKAPINNGQNQLKGGRTAPPRIDASGANRSYLQSTQSISSTSSSKGSVTPTTTGPGRKSPFRMPPRSATAPLPYSPPSPDLPLPQDCAFPVFPTLKSRSTTPTTPSSSKRSFEGTRSRTQTDGSGIIAPRSARPDAGGFLQKMNGSTPGPFNDRARGSRENLRAASAGSNKSVDPNGQIGRVNPLDVPWGGGHGPVQAKTVTSPKPIGVPQTQSLRPLEGSKPSHIPNELPPAGDGLSGKYSVGTPPTLLQKSPAVEPVRQNDRIHNFSFDDTDSVNGTASTEPTPRRPSESSYINHPRRPSVSAANRPLHEIGSASSYKSFRHGPSRSTSPINNNPGSNGPRSASRTGERKDPRLNGAPPVPAPTRAADFDIGNPYHTPTESTSSNGSSSSDTNTGSSRSSPPLSETAYPSRRKPSDAGYSGGPSKTTQTTRSDAKNSQEPPRTRRGTAKSFSRPTYAVPVERAAPPEELPESPMDPAFQSSRFNATSSPQKQQPPPKPSPNQGPEILQPQRYLKPSQPSAAKQTTTTKVNPPSVPSTQTPNDTSATRIVDAPAITAPTLQKPDVPTPARRPTTANKGKCRGCQEIIQGKSVSSADGRLTGRYHKQCFVCHTCKDPFKTADFYVLDNNPYCARHYHALNGSLCKTCDRGIEGQYLETEVKQKFHPHCFTCQECHKILRDDYFELNGKIFCEQHASRAANEPSLLGPGRRHAERRTTRLMMM